MKATRDFLILACVVVLCAASNLQADFTFGQPVKVGWDLTANDFPDCFSYDGLEMYIESYNREGGLGSNDLWVLKRASIEEDWGPPENLGPAVNTAKDEYVASISADGLTLYFASDRAHQWPDICMTTRPTRDAPWGPVVNFAWPVNDSGAGDYRPWISADGLELYFSSYRSGGYGRSDIYAIRRATTNDPWGTPVNLGSVVNSASEDMCGCLSPDGLSLLFSDNPTWGDPPRPGGHGGSDMWMTRRTSRSDPWQTPVNLGPQVNGSAHEVLPHISPDGRTLYFCTLSGGWTNYQAPILPIVDLDGDGKVNDQDVAMMREHWGQADPRCDIGPMPCGDGIVNDEDLKVLLKHAFDPIANASDVPLNVVLSWVPPQFAEAHDVYFATSGDDVSNATRDDSCGVLVSQGQTATTYDPEGILEFGRVYYWRIDEVGGPPDFTITKGPVIEFTTETFAYPIENVTAAASSEDRAMGAEKAVNRSGLDANDGHSTNATDMWQSKGALPQWIQFAFDQVYALDELWVWNSNQLVELMLGFGAKNVTVEYSTDGATWTTLDGVPEFAQATGKAGYTANTIIGFGGVSAKYVKLTINTHWGSVVQQTGLSEVRFFYIPVRPYVPTP